MRTCTFGRIMMWVYEVWKDIQGMGVPGVDIQCVGGRGVDIRGVYGGVRYEAWIIQSVGFEVWIYEVGMHEVCVFLRGVDVVDEGMRIGGVGNGDVIGRGIEGTVGVLVCWDVVEGVY
jgi:hypothetical protein